jgi:hypothetical protein
MPPKRIKHGSPAPATGPGAPCTPPLWGFRALPAVSSAVVRKAPIAAATRPRTPLSAPLALPRGPAPTLVASVADEVLEVAEALEAVKAGAAGEILAAKFCVAATAGEILGAAKAVVFAVSETLIEAGEVGAAGDALADVEAAGEILAAKFCVAATVDKILGAAKAVMFAADETLVDAAEVWAAGEALELAEVEAAGEILAAKVCVAAATGEFLAVAKGCVAAADKTLLGASVCVADAADPFDNNCGALDELAAN